MSDEGGRRRARRLAAILIGALWLCAPRISQAQSCVGDCNLDNAVSVGELVKGVAIAEERVDAPSCTPFDADHDGAVGVTELVSAVGWALRGCPTSFRFTAPFEGSLVLAGTVAATIVLPAGVDGKSLRVTLDGDDVTDVFSDGSRAGLRSGSLRGVEAGTHVLEAIFLAAVPTQVHFEAVSLNHPDECEILNDAECALPYPSSVFLLPAATPNGVRLNLPQIAMPLVNGPLLDVAPYNKGDGFSPTVHVLMHFPQGVDPERSNAARLLAPGCCGQPDGPPWIDTNTYDGRSLDPDSPTLLIDADTGERILHFIEVDARAADDPARQVVFLRPGKSLLPSHRYVVAVRNLKTADGDDVHAEPVFAALRDRRPSAIAALERRRATMERDIFAVLEREGIARSELILAFDFLIRSEQDLTHQMLSMRDQAYAFLDGVAADAGAVTFTVESMETYDCDVEGQVVWRDVAGTFMSPLFLDRDPNQPGVSFLNVDENGEPVQNGFMAAPFSVSIPCAALDAKREIHPFVLGHGFLGSGGQIVGSGRDRSGMPFTVASAAEWSYIAGGTNWIGFSSNDLPWLLENIVGTGGVSAMHNYPALPDRVRQAMVNTLVLAKMMKLGLFNRDDAFRLPSGEGAFHGPEREMFYYGPSLGGILGLFFSALTPDVERFAVDVPTINFIPCLTQRSAQFGPFSDVLTTIGLTDPMKSVLLLGIEHELFVTAEGAGYAYHITGTPLPGAGNPNRMLVTPAWLDKSVPNICTEITARTLGIPSLEGSIQQGLQQIPDLPGPLDSALVTWDAGSFDLFDPRQQPFLPPLANLVPSGRCDPHGARRLIPAAIVQLVHFLRPGGQIENFCEGPGNLCDADRPFEIANGADEPCDPLQ